MLRHAISHARLMRESTDCVQNALLSTDQNQQMIARRILENPRAWSQWENEHSRLMRQLANCGVRHVQVAALKQTTFRLLHAKALFQYLRGSEVRGDQRREVIAHFRPGRSYESAVIVEHTVYLRKACSFICTSHVGTEVVGDDVFLDPLQRYEELYTEYFNVYCSTLIDDPRTEVETRRALLPLLKLQLSEYRWAILDPRRAQPFLRRDRDLRKATGDTQRLPTLPRSKSRRSTGGS